MFHHLCHGRALGEGLTRVDADHELDIRTGADYYVGTAAQDLETAHRLEVSGTHSEDDEVKARLAKKKKQLIAGTSDLPAYACVVGFKTKQIALSDPIVRTEKKTRGRQ